MFSRIPAAITADSLNMRRLSAAAVLGVALFAATACTSSTAAAQPIAAESAAKPAAAPAADTQTTPPGYPAGAALIADGTSTVKVGTRTVTFPTSVTDPSWSPDGSRIAFIDGNGNVATARPDGTGLVTLTVANPAVTRSQPAWNGAEVIFTQTNGSLNTLESVTAPDSPGAVITEQPVFAGDDDHGNPITNDLAPSTRDQNQSELSGELAYQHLGSSGPEVWIVDYAQRENSGFKEVDGSNPALSPDGSTVAFVDNQGDIEVTGTNNPAYSHTTAPVQITFGAATVAPTNLTWSPDGTRLAYSQGGKILSVPAKPAGQTADPAVISATPGTVTYLDLATPDQLARFADTDPVALSVAASRDRWVSVTQYAPSQSDTNAYAAAIGSSTDLASDQSLAPKDYTGPLLLTGGQSLDPRTAAELHRVLGTPGVGETPTVYLLGSTAQLSSSVEQSITKMGYQVQRITKPDTSASTPAETSYGANRYMSFVAVDQDNPLDELIGTAFAESYGAPVVNVGGGALPTSAAGWIAQAGGSATITAVFAPAPAGTALATAISGIEGSPLGTTFTADPAKPFGLS